MSCVWFAVTTLGTRVAILLRARTVSRSSALSTSARKSTAPCRLPPPPSASPLQEVVSAMNLHRLGDESLEESDTLSGQGQDLSGSERG